MLKGFNYPLTPHGKSTLNPAPPWHYSSDFLGIEFWADPAQVAALLARGWSQGYPKRLAQVFQTRLHAAPSLAAPQLAQGAKFGASMSASGRRLAEGLVVLDSPLADPAALGQRPVINLLHTPRLAAGMQDKPAVHELVMNVPREVRIAEAWIGQGKLVLPEVAGEELSALAPRRCGAGVRASMAYIVDDLKTVKPLA